MTAALKGRIAACRTELRKLAPAMMAAYASAFSWAATSPPAAPRMLETTPVRAEVMSAAISRMPTTRQKLPLVSCHDRRIPSHTPTFSRMRAALEKLRRIVK